MTDLATIDFTSFISKAVLLTAVIDDENVTLEGTITAASPVGVVFKEKGKRNQHLVEAANIETIEPVKKTTSMRIRAFSPVVFGKNKDHLIDRHGYKVSDIEKLSEEDAERLHESLDHSDLGHRHRKPRAVEAAIADAEQVVSDYEAGYDVSRDEDDYEEDDEY